MSIDEQPSVRQLREQMTAIGIIPRINGLLRNIGLGSKNVAALQGKYSEMRQQLKECTEYPRKFNAHFSEDGWLAHDSMDFNVIKRAVDEFETNGKDHATNILLDYYGPDQIEGRLYFFHGVEEL